MNTQTKVNLFSSYLGTRDDLSTRRLGPFRDTRHIGQPQPHAHEPIPEVVALHAIVVRQLDAEVLPPIGVVESKQDTPQHTNMKERERKKTVPY